MTKSISEITVEIDNFVNKLNHDLQISTPSKLLVQKAATALSGFTTAFFTPFSSMIADAVEKERLIDEISAIANLSRGEVVDFYQTHPYSLEFIKAAIQAGAKLDKEDIKRTMEERATYHWNRLTGNEVPDLHNEIIDKSAFEGQDGKRVIYLDLPFFPPTWADIERAQAMNSPDIYTFVVTLPDGDRREVKAAYMEVDGGALYFEDDDHETILAFGPGHWVWAERVEEEDASNG